MKKLFMLMFMVFTFIILPLLILLNVIDFDQKFYVLVIGAIFLYCVMRFYGYKNSELGLSFKNNLQSIKSVLPSTLVIVLLSIIFYLFNGNRFVPNETWGFYIFYIFISCPLQELLYRGILGVYLKSNIKNEKCVGYITAILYSFTHIVYKDLLTILLTFIIGLIWYQEYKKTHNLLGVTISHIILGISTIFLGIIN